MNKATRTISLAALTAAWALAAPAGAVVQSQCPANLLRDGGGDVLRDGYGQPTGETDDPDVYCRHLAAGDGYAVMADGKVLYIFGFADLTGVPDDEVLDAGMLAAQFSAPTLRFPEGKKVYLTLTNVGMLHRPDLFDPHTVHFHGYPNAASVFDGEPMASISVNMGSSLTYFYVAPDPGTYMYHCHVEATEHMQMGMLGNLYVTPTQDAAAPDTVFGAHVHEAGDRYVFNDGDGSTRYDFDYPIQMVSFDPVFHEQHIAVQPLPFANMRDTYPMLNGRGYPDTTDPAPLPPPAENGGKVAQPLPALIEVTQGERILLRISSLSTVGYYTLGLAGLTMEVVGRDARQLKGPGGNLYYRTSALTLGGGESADAIIDTGGVAPGTYALYVKNLHHLSNDAEDFGGMMTEIVINAP